MRRAAQTIALVLLALAAPTASAAAAPPDEVRFELEFRAPNGMAVAFNTNSAEEPGEEDKVRLTISEGSRFVTYIVKPKLVSSEGFDAVFGRLGRFRADFEPLRVVEKDPCGARAVEGWFVGEFRFRGEQGYVEIDRTRARGKVTTTPVPCQRRPRAAATEKENAQLEARLPGKRPRVVSVLHLDDGKRSADLFSAAAASRREGMLIASAAIAVAEGHRFVFDHKRGTATIRPPAPFSGSAHFVRRPGGRNEWRGNLSAPLLGIGRVHFAGPGFRAGLKDEGLSFG